MRTGQLTIHKYLLDIEYESPYFILHRQHDAALECDHLVLALGSGNDPESLPLLARMLQQQLISKHPLGGLRIAQSTYQVVNDQPHAPTKIYALGDLVKGACFNTIELGQVVEQAQIITQHLVKEIVSSYAASTS